MRKHRQKLLLATIFGVTAADAWAVTVPSSARPEVIQRQYETQMRPEVGGAPVISVPDEGVKQLKGDVSFELKAVEFEGATKYSAEDLEHLYAGKIGTRITLSELNKIAADVTAFYRNQGYILTRAIVPPQRIQGGKPKIRIVEGFVSDVKVQGDVGSQQSVIYSYAEKIKASQPLNAKTLERYLLLMEDLPGVQARAVLQPSAATPGASDVVVNITRKPVDASVSFDNRGSRFLGPYQLGASVAANNAVGLDEQTQLRAVNSIFEAEELKFGEIRHEEQLGSEGTKLLLSANYVVTNPGASLEPLDVHGQSTAFTAGLIHPLLRSRQANWFINSDFTARRVSVNIDSPKSNIYLDYLRVLTFGTAYDFIDSTSAVNRMEGSVAKGFGWDADNKGLAHSRSGGEASFVKFSGQASRLQPISGPFAAYVAVSGQYGADSLLSAEEFALGGAQFGSAYDEAELTGDSGVATRVELQYSGSRQEDFLSSYQVYGFYDIGKVWNRNVVAASELSHASLASTGIGARFNLMQSLSGGAEVAVPLTRDVAAYGEDGSAPRFFFNLQYRY